MAVFAHGVHVFPAPTAPKGAGGNPTTIFFHADQLTHAQMQELAQACVHECGFVVAGPVLATDSLGQPFYDLSIQFWVPGHEMEMCGHATIGALWLMDELGMFSKARRVSVTTKAGIFEGLLPQPRTDELPSSQQVLVSQPRGSAKPLSPVARQLVAEALGISTEDMIAPEEIQNSTTSRTKTLVPLKNFKVLQDLHPVQSSVQSACEDIGSTGLYPYAQIDETTFSARQFPKSSGYLEDPATGIAATALVCGVLERGTVAEHDTRPILIRQGEAMGRPSEIQVLLRRDSSSKVMGYWLSGNVTSMDLNENVIQVLNGFK